MIHPIEYRYGSKEMREIFSRDSWVKYSINVEFKLLEALSDIGLIDVSRDEIYRELDKLSDVSYEEVKRYEEVTRHETMALIRLIYDRVDRKIGRYLHLAMTSNDLLDNVLMLQIRDGLNIIIRKVDELINILENFIRKHIDVPILGRTHGQAATPITLGLRFSLYLDELERSRRELMYVKENYVVGKLGGSVGSQVEIYPHGPKVEDAFLRKLGLKKADIYLQILPRDLITYIVLRIIILSSILEHIANEIRILSREGIGELFEYFEEGQVGSSVMPHKRNPVMSEKICGLGRYLRGLSSIILENIVFEDERDLRNSSLERILIPEVFILVDEQLDTLKKVFSKLWVDIDRCKRNILEAGYQIYSSVLLHIGVLKGGDRQVIHERLRKIFSKRYRSIDELYESLSKDEVLRNIYSYEDLLSAVNLDKYVEAAINKVRNYLD